MGDIDIGYLESYSELNPWIRVIRLPLALLGILMAVALLSQVDQLFTMYGVGVVVVVSFGNIAMNVFNEVSDIKDDKENKPWRPLPSGEIESDSAFAFAMVMLLISFFGISLIYRFGGWLPSVIIGSTLTLGLVYNFGRRDILGVVCMGIAYAGAGMVSLYPEYRLMILFGLGFGTFTVAHNIIQQVQDRKEDLKWTVPKQISSFSTLLMADILAIASCFYFYTIWVRHESVIALIALTPLMIVASLPLIIYTLGISVVTDFVVVEQRLDRIIEVNIRGWVRGILIFATIVVLIEGLIL